MSKIETQKIIQEMIEKFPILEPAVPSLLEFCQKMIDIYETGGKLLIAGNGGSAADAQHIAGELMKSFERKHPLTEKEKSMFKNWSDGDKIANHIENGLPVIVLGLNHSLTSAISNDYNESYLEFAQELWVSGKKGDAFLGISTSGHAQNIINAIITAKAKGLYTVALTGNKSNPVKDIAEHSICVPSSRTMEVQQMHEIIYHIFCKILEDHFFS
jgi:D-sedoheptulose 7-phosphate isomerase